jgi:hypothetical protein
MVKNQLPEVSKTTKSTFRPFWWTALFAAGTIIAVYVGFSFPNSYSTTLYNVSYFDGIYRRGLLGTLLSPVWQITGTSYWAQATFALIILLAVWVAVGLFYFRSKDATEKVVVLIWLFAPTGAAFLHLAGYIDHVIYLCLFVSLFLLKKDKVFYATVLISFTPLMHEIALLTVIPVFLWAFFFQGKTTGKQKLLCFAPLSVSGFVLLLPTSSVETVEVFVERLSTTSDFVVNTLVVEVFTKNLSEVWEQYYLWTEVEKVIIFFACLMVFWLVVTVWGFRSSKRLMISLFATASAVAPLFLSFGGYDTGRWVTLAFTNTALLFLMWRKTMSCKSPASFVVLLGVLFCLLLYVPSLFPEHDVKPRPVTLDYVTNMDWQKELRTPYIDRE